jgi:hypothetical protein
MIIGQYNSSQTTARKQIETKHVCNFLRLFAVSDGLRYFAGNCDSKSLRCFAVIIGQYNSSQTTARKQIEM